MGMKPVDDDIRPDCHQFSRAVDQARSPPLRKNAEIGARTYQTRDNKLGCARIILCDVAPYVLDVVEGLRCQLYLHSGRGNS